MLRESRGATLNLRRRGLPEVPELLVIQPRITSPKAARDRPDDLATRNPEELHPDRLAGSVNPPRRDRVGSLQP